MLSCDQRFFVVTGGPGSGKTTLSAALSRAGLACMPEAGRAIIRDQTAIGGSALPWADAHAFAEQMLAFDIQNHRRAEGTDGPVLFDRGILDVVGYLRLTGLPIPAHCETIARTFRYHRKVFAAPPWQAIFTQDTERKQTFDEAEATFEMMMQVYGEHGHELVLLPRDTVETRAQFVMDTIARCI